MLRGGMIAPVFYEMRSSGGGIGEMRFLVDGASLK